MHTTARKDLFGACNGDVCVQCGKCERCGRKLERHLDSCEFQDDLDHYYCNRCLGFIVRTQGRVLERVFTAVNEIMNTMQRSRTTPHSLAYEPNCNASS